MSNSLINLTDEQLHELPKNEQLRYSQGYEDASVLLCEALVALAESDLTLDQVKEQLHTVALITRRMVSLNQTERSFDE